MTGFITRLLTGKIQVQSLWVRMLGQSTFRPKMGLLFTQRGTGHWFVTFLSVVTGKDPQS